MVKQLQSQYDLITYDVLYSISLFPPLRILFHLALPSTTHLSPSFPTP
jgi:hypothetical protein